MTITQEAWKQAGETLRGLRSSLKEEPDLHPKVRRGLRAKIREIMRRLSKQTKPA